MENNSATDKATEIRPSPDVVANWMFSLLPIGVAFVFMWCSFLPLTWKTPIFSLLTGQLLLLWGWRLTGLCMVCGKNISVQC
ncbi:MAG: hypothetical protein HZT40_08035 [Candidatus Thiothrix singaporensis]|uniref:Uncharacterized protein n=1 Tax=Candidatus Thiothrix singaporensis TaxID=2799669 RepID=A0A7L6AQW6_9GAMM|nr:MAG: hypothetical protein HZT40_08035 [Candidatus Thiothrix singaporensis]